MANQRIEKLSDSLQNAINAVFLAKGAPPHRLKSILNGTWLGHSLHTVITDIPIGGLVFTAIFDIFWLASSTTFAWAAHAAQITLIVAALGAMGAIITGMADWSDTYGRERSTGLLHGSLNILGFVLFIISIILRFTTTANGESVGAAIISFVSLAIIAYSAYLGGDLVFTLGTNVNHTAWEHGNDEFAAVMPLAAVAEHTLYRVTAAGIPVTLMRDGEKIYAISATCSHAGGPLDEGALTGDVVTCPWHGSQFCLRDGKVRNGPATAAQPSYDTRVVNGQIEIKRR